MILEHFSAHFIDMNKIKVNSIDSNVFAHLKYLNGNQACVVFFFSFSWCHIQLVNWIASCSDLVDSFVVHSTKNTPKSSVSAEIVGDAKKKPPIQRNERGKGKKRKKTTTQPK